MSKGNIGVTTENIFPVIKKFLYSDHEIFLREMVSNAVDATQKLKTLSEDRGGDRQIHQPDRFLWCPRLLGQVQRQCQRHHRTFRSWFLQRLHGE